MAAPTFVAAGTGATDTGGAWTYTTHAPAAAENLILIHVLEDGNTGLSDNVSITSATNVEQLDGTDGNFTKLRTDGFPVGSPTLAGYQHLFAGRALGTSAIVITGANAGANDIYVRAYEFANVSAGTTIASILENTTAGNFADTAALSDTASDVAVTTLGPDRLALNLVAVNDDNAISVFTGETGGDWTLAVTPFAESSGTDGAIALQIAPDAPDLITGTDIFFAVGNNAALHVQVAQSFIPLSSLTSQYVDVSLDKTGTPTDSLVLEIQTNSSGLPSGTVLGSFSIPAASITAGVNRFGPITCSLTSGTTYWIVLRRSGSQDISNYYTWEVSGAGYGDGAGYTAAWDSASVGERFTFGIHAPHTIDGGTGSIVATDAWGVVGFALIGTTVSAPPVEALVHTELTAVSRASVW